MCGSCMDASGLLPDAVVKGATASNRTELAGRIAVAERTLTLWIVRDEH